MQLSKIILFALIYFAFTSFVNAQFTRVENYIRKQPGLVYYWHESSGLYESRQTFRVVLSKADTDTSAAQYEYLFLKSWQVDNGESFYYYVPIADSSSGAKKLLSPSLNRIDYLSNNKKPATSLFEQNETIIRLDSYLSKLSEYQALSDEIKKCDVADRLGGIAACLTLGIVMYAWPDRGSSNNTNEVIGIAFLGYGIGLIPSTLTAYHKYSRISDNLETLNRQLERISNESDSLPSYRN
jgi:hypothetical protein